MHFVAVSRYNEQINHFNGLKSMSISFFVRIRCDDVNWHDFRCDNLIRLGNSVIGIESWRRASKFARNAVMH